MKNSKTILAVLCALASLTGQASAQQSFNVPQSAAFTFLDASPTKVEHPSTARDFGAGLLNGIDAKGRAVQGLAMEAAPWTWLGVSIPAESYSKLSKYALANLTLSFGTARSASDSASTDAALGLRTTLVDKTDPMADPAFRAKARELATKCNTSDADATDASVHDCAVSGLQQLRKDWLDSNWNKSSLSIAIATGARLKESRFDQREWSGVSAWAAGSLSLGTHGQMLGQARIDHKPAVDTIAKNTTLRAGARALFGSSSANAFLELEWKNKADAASARKSAWSGGVEFKAANDLWVATGFGKAYATHDSDKIVMLANVRWRVSSSAGLIK